MMTSLERTHVDALRVWSEGSVSDCDCEQLYSAFRYFRDLCTKSQSMQNYLCTELLDLSVKILNKLILSYQEKFFPPFKQGLQFIYNLTVSNSHNLLNIWGALREHFLNWMKFENESVKNYTCGILYNITLQHEDLCIDVINNIPLLNCITNSALQGTDFPILFLENLWKMLGSDDADMLMDNLCNCSKSVFVCLLNMIYEFIKDSSDSEIHLSFVIWLVIKYKKVVNSINVELPNCLDDVQEAYMLLKLIVVFSSRDGYSLFLQRDIELLVVTKVLLERVHAEGKRPDSVFSPTEDMFARRTSVENLKANLIRLIGNLCWRNKVMQDKVRDCSGLPLILDCCIRDGKNPFITEIVVFAIRNLCEGNIENQNFIKAMNAETHSEMSERTQNWPSVFVPS